MWLPVCGAVVEVILHGDLQKDQSVYKFEGEKAVYIIIELKQ